MIFDRLGTIVSRHWMVVLFCWLVLVVGIHQVAPRWDEVTHDGDFAYLPDRTTSVRGEKLLEAAFPDYFSKSQVALVLARADGKLCGADYAVAERLIKAFPPGENGRKDLNAAGGRNQRGQESSENPVSEIWSHQTPVLGKKLTSRVTANGQATLIVLHLRNEFMAIDNMDFMRRVHRTLAEITAEADFPQGLRLGVTGSAAVGDDMLSSAEESIRNTEMTAIALVILILLVVYRSPGLVIVPLVAIGTSVFLATDLVALLAEFSGQVQWLDFKIFKTTRIFVVVILFGAGTDYCLFLIARYKEELRRGLDHKAAIGGALSKVGNALAASALTTIFGLGMMFFADFGKFSNSGPAIALCLAVALVACVSLAPALLRAMGRIVFWPFGVGPAGGNHGRPTIPVLDPAGSSLFGRFWERLARGVIARPGLILIVSLLVLAPLTRPVRVLVGNLVSPGGSKSQRQFSVPVSYDLLSELRNDRPSVRGTHLLWRHFSADQTGAITILAYDSKTRFNSKEGRQKISKLTKEIFNLEIPENQIIPNGDSEKLVRPIVGVRSLTEPLGERPGIFNPFSSRGRRKLASIGHPKTRDTFVSKALDGKVTRFDLTLCYDPFSRQAVNVFNYLEERLRQKADSPDSAWAGTTFDFLGTTAGIRDLEVVTTSDRHRIQLLVVLAVLAVLIIILRHPTICFFLILSVLLGYYVTIGTTELFFSWLWGESFIGLDWKVPLFLFVILIAVGEDYNIYLTTRVFEEQRRLGPLEGLRVAVVRTGGIITSCGLIMAGTFASMATGTLRTMLELGFALSLGVLLDTFIIRTILVPAFLAILARREMAKEAKETLPMSEPPPSAEPAPKEHEVIASDQC